MGAKGLSEVIETRTEYGGAPREIRAPGNRAVSLNKKINNDALLRCCYAGDMYCLRSFIISAGNLDVLFGKRGGLFLIVQFIDSFRCRVEEYIRAACLHASRNALLRSRGIVSLHHHFVRIRLRAISIRDYATKATFFLSSEARS